MTSSRPPILLTPGPLTTSERTRRAMLTDWGSWESDFNALTASLCGKLLDVANASGTHVCVPLQGSGTFAVEAAVGTLVPRDGKALVLVNGAYGARIVTIFQTLGRAHVELKWPEDQPVAADAVARALQADSGITHVVLVHCETTTGLLNPLQAVAQVVAEAGRKLILDAMSSFGALPIDLAATPCEAVIAASGKCLEGVPGMGFILADEAALAASRGNCHSVAMDLHAQHAYMQKTGQWRFTPPTHVVAALHEAVLQYEEAGGLPARQQRYAANCRALLDGMKSLGFRLVIDEAHQAPIIMTFHAPRDPAYAFPPLHKRMREKGFILYPGKLTQLETFRVGCIGAVTPQDMRDTVAAFRATLDELGIREI